ncbi:FecR family protein [Pseudoflavitalea rhizosphaerae]|uniref:FecR family protein n=1 Tax=Pseudoflavitalea rhizosphaerae TaxID=1884793 RepID=UPI000F8D4ACA|nr:FecR domain-containing protein [Pseudoflavitalea rhizosphaerae]
MKITEAQIRRYFNNECDTQERQAISEYFIRHPEVLEKYLTEQSWENFEVRLDLPMEISKKLLSAIRTNTYEVQRRRAIRRNWTAAAAILLLITGGIWYTQTNRPKAAKTIAAKEVAPAVAPLRYQRRFNSTNKTLSLVLEDSSCVQLSPNSELIYPQPFLHDKRSIILKGEARFDVAKDQARPFTVYAGQLATTALGTVFSISAFEGKNIRVHLMSGKVRVEADSSMMTRGMKSAILLPGQQLQLNGLHQMVITDVKVKTRRVPIPVPAKTKAQPGSQLMVFHNESLESIFNRLADHFKTNIQFRPEQMAGMTFTGKFDPEKESLLEFIQTIGLLNNLSAANENGIIQVTVQ